MSFTDPRLQEDLMRTLRQYESRIAELERKSLEDVPVGAAVQYNATLRSPVSSKSHEAAVGALGTGYNIWFPFNESGEHVGLPKEKNNTVGLSYIPGSTGAGVKLGEPGGMVSEGSYSIYLPGNGARYEFIYNGITATNDWTVEILFKPRISQNAVVAFWGDNSANGFGMRIDSSNNFRFFHRVVEDRDTGLNYLPGEWNHGVFSRVGGQIYTILNGAEANWIPASFVGTYTPKFNIGAYTTGTEPFDGWIDFVTVRGGAYIPHSGLTPGTMIDRYQASLVPLPPTGWIKADGSSVSKSEYARLWSVYRRNPPGLQTATHFNLPNISGNWLIKV